MQVGPELRPPDFLDLAQTTGGSKVGQYHDLMGRQVEVRIRQDRVDLYFSRPVRQVGMACPPSRTAFSQRLST
jgi:hypothetical protein